MIPLRDSSLKAGIRPERIQLLNDAPVREEAYVLYWMQASQRCDCNHALEYAVHLANELDKPLLVCFGLTDSYPGANLRHYRFMLEGLRDVNAGLAKRGIRFVLRQGDPATVALGLAGKACLLVMDRGYTRVQRAWRDAVMLDAPCRCIQVEGDVVVPVEWASTKEEYAARTLRPKIHRCLNDFLIPLRKARVKHSSLDLRVKGLSVEDPAERLKALAVDTTIGPSPLYRGGEKEARRRLRRFVTSGLAQYDTDRNDPTLDATSHLSPHLHFGQISPLAIALSVEKSGEGVNQEAFIEQLVVRRELAINYVFFNPRYDEYNALPDWCRATLQKHRKDKREHLYTPDQLRDACTHDPYWNAAQLQMVKTGTMHNYMRMYWGKKVLEWSSAPQKAWQILMGLNDAYELDGRDPSGYTGVAWCFGKHDRPWTERAVFGTIRYMNANGLRRKFAVDDYVRWVEDLPTT